MLYVVWYLYGLNNLNTEKLSVFVLINDFNKLEALDNYDSKQNIWYEDNVLRVSKNGKYGLIDFEGKEVLACDYDEITALKGVKSNIIVKKAYCSICGKPAKFTQRLENGKPSKLGKTVIIGNEEYTPRCSKCFVSPFSL